MKTIPILRNHDLSPSNVIGNFEDGLVTLSVSLDQDSLSDVFGNIGYRITERVRDGNIKQLRIIEWSVVEFRTISKDKLRHDAFIIKMLEAVEDHRLTAVEAAQMICRTGKEYK